MRDIKFRGKRVDNGQWVYGWFVGNYTANYAYIINWDNIEHTGEESRYEVIPETVGQFCGLKDKNGKEIYAGDIINYDGYNSGDVSIRWSIEYCAWMTGDSRWKFLNQWNMGFTIIKGNIYQNHELLKEEK